MKPMNYLLVISLFLALAFSGLADLTDVEICDPGVDLETVRVCYNNDAGTARTAVVDSITKLNRINQKPLFLPVENLTFIYEQPLTGTAKNVSIILALDITTRLKEANYFIFGSSLLASQRLMLIQNNEYYLLEHPRAALFSLASLKLTHIPTLNEYPAVPYQGTDSYVFTVLGGRQIEITRTADGQKVLIRTAALGEAPAAYVIPHNLTEEYEVAFNYNNPVEIIDPVSVGTLTVCQNDNIHDAEQIKICLDNNYNFTLRRNVLTKHQVPAAGGNYLFLFTIVEGTKQVALFDLADIDNNDDLNHSFLHYDNFIDDLVAGRRLGIEFNHNLYLLSHPVADFISLPNITLKNYSLAGITTLPAVGSEAQIEFVTLDGGKMYLQRNYGTPPPPFGLWALEQHELRPVNLEEELFTSFSSLGVIRITTPNLGTISVRDNDIRFSSAMFKIQASELASPTLDLTYRQPLVRDTALFYYHSANINQGTPVKTVSIYRYYNLSDDQDAQHYYNDTFIHVFTGGREIALGFGNSYYLLGHENIPDEPAFFDIAKLTLKTLDGTETFEQEQVSATEVSFAIPEGAITVTIDDLRNLIKFQAETTRILEGASLERADEYSADLTPINSVRLTNTTTLQLCNLESFRSSPAADVCVYGDKNTVINEILVDEYRIETIGTVSYLLRTNGRTGDAKVVTVSKILQFDPRSHDFSIPDWNNFTQNLLNGNIPAFDISNIVYLPVVVDNLLTDFAFRRYPGGAVPYSLANIRMISPITYNGSFVLDDTVVFAKQGLSGPLDQRIISTTFSLRPYKYIPDNGDALTVTSPASTQQFVTSVSGDIYTLTITNPTEHLAKLRLTAGASNLIFDRHFAQGDSRMLRLDNVLTEFTLTGVTTGKANVTIQRVIE